MWHIHLFFSQSQNHIGWNVAPEIMGVIFRDAPSESMARLSESISSPARMASRISNSMPSPSSMFGFDDMIKKMGSEI